MGKTGVPNPVTYKIKVNRGWRKGKEGKRGEENGRVKRKQGRKKERKKKAGGMSRKHTGSQPLVAK